MGFIDKLFCNHKWRTFNTWLYSSNITGKVIRGKEVVTCDKCGKMKTLKW